MSYTQLYILVMVLAFLLMNSWIVLARFVQQIKLPPTDQDFEGTAAEKKMLEKDLDTKNEELAELQARFQELELKLSSSNASPSSPSPAN